MYRTQLSPDYGADYGCYDADNLEEEELRKSIKYRKTASPKRAQPKRRKQRKRSGAASVQGMNYRRNHRWSW